MNVIELNHLAKDYRRFQKEPGIIGSIKSLFHRQYSTKRAVSDFNLAVQDGEFIGIIGPNGAGKTSLVKMLTGIIAPTSGDISVLGYYPNHLENSFKQQYAVVMGQKSQLFLELSAADTFLLFQQLYEIPDKEFRQNLQYFVDLFDVSSILDVQVRTLSLGERMKMELITALLHNPRVLFLDEPTIGLDAIAQKQIRRFLKEVNETRNTTILLTSHYMEDIQSLCKRCVVINHGEKIYDGNTAELFHRYQSHKRVSVSFDTETSPTLPDGCTLIEANPYHISFLIPRDHAGDTLRSWLADHSFNDITIEEDDIGSVVERIYRERHVIEQ